MLDIRNRVRNALLTIVRDRTRPALNYAVGYAEHGLTMLRENASDGALRTQLLYVVCNITAWRGDDAVVVRGVLKEAIKHLKEDR